MCKNHIDLIMVASGDYCCLLGGCNDNERDEDKKERDKNESEKEDNDYKEFGLRVCSIVYSLKN